MYNLSILNNFNKKEVVKFKIYEAAQYYIYKMKKGQIHKDYKEYVLAPENVPVRFQNWEIPVEEDIIEDMVYEEEGFFE
jgi:hypothetical protein